MPAEPNLTAAAANAYTNMATTAATDWLAFGNAVLPSFPDAQPNNHPVANWCAVLMNLAQNIINAGGTIDPLQLKAAVDYVFRICLLTNYLAGVPVAPPLITGAQAAVVLAAYNAHL